MFPLPPPRTLRPGLTFALPVRRDLGMSEPSQNDETPAPLYEEVKLQDATELLDVLTPHKHDQHLWDRGDEGDWIFRGQAEAVWKLVPAAHRPDAFLPFVPGQLHTPLSRTTKLLYEFQHVMEFAGLITEKGLEVPGDSQELRHPSALSLDEKEFPPVKYRGIFGLAQHHGIPTRLLDWTWKPLVAAYFAAVDPARREVDPGQRAEESDGQLAIWALQRRFLIDVCRHWDPGAVPVTVPTKSNPNIALQAGLFTLVFFRRADETFPRWTTCSETLATSSSRARWRTTRRSRCCGNSRCRTPRRGTCCTT
jgi:FRG domain-containing protein